eukprot:2172694-Amphidinium_carterae.1
MSVGFEGCQALERLHLQRLRNVRAPNAFACRFLGMVERQILSLAAFEECESAQMASLAALEECQSAKCLHLQRLRNA